VRVAAVSPVASAEVRLGCRSGANEYDEYMAATAVQGGYG
jgi:hypothetical protein